MIKTKYLFSEAKAKDTTSKAKDLAPKAKDMTSCPRGQGHGLEDSISGVNRTVVHLYNKYVFAHVVVVAVQT